MTLNKAIAVSERKLPHEEKTSISAAAFTPMQESGPTRYIRVRSRPEARFVEFDFAIGDPALFVELIMPPAVFEAFCSKNQVVHMTEEQMQRVDTELNKWRYGEDTLMAANHGRD